MPRKKYISKSSYCFGSKLTDETFRFVLASFLDGSSAKYSAERLQKIEIVFRLVRKKVRSEKTPADVASEETRAHIPSEEAIRGYYKKLGNRLFELVIEDVMLGRDETILQLRRDNPVLYEENLHAKLLQIHQQLIDKEKGTPLPQAQKDYLFILEEYRKLSCSKYGIQDSVKENVALALFRCLARTSVPNAETISEDKMRALILGKTFLMLEEELRRNPL